MRQSNSSFATRCHRQDSCCKSISMHRDCPRRDTPMLQAGHHAARRGHQPKPPTHFVGLRKDRLKARHPRTVSVKFLTLPDRTFPQGLYLEAEHQTPIPALHALFAASKCIFQILFTTSNSTPARFARLDCINAALAYGTVSAAPPCKRAGAPCSAQNQKGRWRTGLTAPEADTVKKSGKRRLGRGDRWVAGTGSWAGSPGSKSGTVGTAADRSNCEGCTHDSGNWPK